MQYPPTSSVPPLDSMSQHCRTWFFESVGEVRQLTPIAEGHHKNWLCHANKGRFVLRQPSVSPLSGVDYRRETSILQAVTPYVWAMKANIFKPCEPWLVSHYVEGCPGHSKMFQASDMWQQLMVFFEQQHKITMSVSDRTTHRHMASYLSQSLAEACQTSAGREFSRRASIWLSNVELKSEPSLNHHDITPQNIRVTSDGQLVLLDWEYAAVSLYGWDAASLSEHFILTEKQHKALAHHFNLPSLQLRQWCHASKLLNLLWYWANCPEYPQLTELSRQWFKRAM